MAIKFRCPHCQQLLGISTTKAGTIVDCPACGRSVNVPAEGNPAKRSKAKPPSSKDPGLLNALQELSALGGATTRDVAAPPVSKIAPRERKSSVQRTPSAQPDAASPNRDRDTMRIVPLANTNAAAGTATQPKGASSDFTSTSQTETAEPQILDERLEADASNPIQAIDSPVPASTARPVPHDLTSALQELAVGPHTVPASANRSEQPIPELTARRSTLLPLMYALPAFAMGLLLGTFWQSNNSQRVTESVTKPSEAIPIAKPIAPDAGERQISGIVTYIDDSGNPIADAGAAVLLLPNVNTTRLRLDVRPLREAADSKARQAIEAALQTLGASVCHADSNGQWSAHVAENTAFHAIVISRHRSRTESQPVPADAFETLSSWFDSPLHIVGRLAVQQVVVPSASGVNSDSTPLQIEFARAQ
jgi:hypothetical protein